MKRRSEKKKIGFLCISCKKFVKFRAPGTQHRNHCPFCLYSKHLDYYPGDRRAVCGGAMRPVGLTYKSEGEGKIGELMVVHQCQKCGFISKNRIAGDDDPEAILVIYKESLSADGERAAQLSGAGIRILTQEDGREVLTQLFGKPNLEARLKTLL